MSFARFALRTATVKALRGRTFAGDMVRDSEIGPIDDAAKDKEIPFVVVYTDDVEGDGAGTDLCESNGKHCLVLEIGVTTRMKAKGEWAIPTTDAGMELTIDAIERQIRLALGNPANAWAELWRDLVLSIDGRKSQRGAAAKDGVRFAGRQLVLDVALPREPHPGRPLGPIWQRFMALAAADADLAGLVPMLTQLATGGGEDWPEWRRVRAAYGLSAERARALHIAPPAPAEATSPDFADLPPSPSSPVAPVYLPTLVE